jgi:hypothetical protein
LVTSKREQNVTQQNKKTRNKKQKGNVLFSLKETSFSFGFSLKGPEIAGARQKDDGAVPCHMCSYSDRMLHLLYGKRLRQDHC